MAIINYTINLYCSGKLYDTRSLQHDDDQQCIVCIEDEKLSIEGYFYNNYDFSNGMIVSTDHGHTLIAVSDGAEVNLYYDANLVEILYKANGGTVSNGYKLAEDGMIGENPSSPYFGAVSYGETVKPRKPEVFGLVKSGYTFIGWKVVGTNTILDPNVEYDSTVYNADVAEPEICNCACYLEAQWTPIECTITFDPNNGTLRTPGTNLNNGINTNSIIVTYGSRNYYDMSGDIPVCDDYVFRGWFTQSGDKVYSAEGVGVIDEYQNLEQYWHINRQWINVDATNKVLHAEYGVQVKGPWKLNNVLTNLPSSIHCFEKVNFTVGTVSYNEILTTNSWAPVLTLYYDYDNSCSSERYYYEDDAAHEINTGWLGGSADTINFGDKPQVVTKDFYDWLIANATYLGSIDIDIKNSGTITLNTVGKRCDRNININVDIPKYDDKLVDVTITEFVNSTVESIGVYGLGYKGALKRIDVSKVKSIADKAFYNNRVLDTLIIRTPEVCTLATATDTFKNTKIASGQGYIFVPDALVNAYKQATNWTTYASQIKPISELEV